MFLRTLALLFLASSLVAQQRRPVLMISIDGLRPDYVTHADEHQLKIPTLCRFLTEGTYADGVVGVFPTVTYPSHTTLVTGVWPAEHGIFNNTRFDPEHKFGGAWYWYADQVKVPTLWSAAKAASGAVTVTNWSAEPWPLEAMFAIMLHNPSDTATFEKVHMLLTKLAADPNNGIEAVLDQKHVAALGGVPQASFVVTLKPGYASASLTGALVRESPLKATHGYNPQTTPEMHASFLAIGPGIHSGKDLGIIDMRRIAPTVAGLLQISLPTATQPALDLH